MSPTVWSDKEYILADAAHMAEKLHVSEDDFEEFRPIYETCVQIASPKFLWREAAVEEINGRRARIGGVDFESRVLAVNLRSVKTVYAYVSTCGREIYRYAQTLTDPLERYWADAISEQVMHVSGARAYKRLLEHTGAAKLFSMNPGSLPDWPISQQRPLFDLIGNVYEAVGVELKESFLMLPEKSGSGIYFDSDEEFTNCEYCAWQGCPKRRAPFCEGKFAQRYGE